MDDLKKEGYHVIITGLKTQNAELRAALTNMLTIHGCGCESVTDGGWTCPAHEILKKKKE